MKRHFFITVFCTCLLWACGGKGKVPTPTPPEVDDPITEISIPGAYGVPGGSQTYNYERCQLSVLQTSGSTLSFRILDPGERKVVTVSGIPAAPIAGNRVHVSYRLMVNGYSLQSADYEDALVLKVTDSMIWLKEDDTTYFVLKR